MYISQTVAKYLDRNEVDFDVLAHARTRCSSQTAKAAHIARDDLAKGVVLLMGHDMLMALVPASKRVDPNAVGALLHAGEPGFAEEEDLPFIFRDCQRGAVPATGPAFGLPTVVDEALLRRRDVYFEGGDHEHLVHVRGGDFARLWKGQLHGRISC